MFSFPLCCCESAQVSSDWKSTWQTFNAGLVLVPSKTCPDDQHLGSQLEQTLQEGEWQAWDNPAPHPRAASFRTSWAELGVSLENICSVWKLFKLCTSIVTLKKTPSPLKWQGPGKALPLVTRMSPSQDTEVPWASTAPDELWLPPLCLCVSMAPENIHCCCHTVLTQRRL